MILIGSQVEAFARPSTETTAAVTQWLSDNGIEFTPSSSAGDWISIAVPAAKANELLKADFSVFTHTASGQQSIRTLEYSIPASLQSHIKLVTPTTSYVGCRCLSTFSKCTSDSMLPVVRTRSWSRARRLFRRLLPLLVPQRAAAVSHLDSTLIR